MTQGAPAQPPDRRRRHQLGRELARLRKLAGLSGRDLAARIGIGQSSVSRIENGHAVPPAPEVRAWAAAVGAPEETVAHLLLLTEAAHTEVETWRTAVDGVDHLQDRVRDLETRAGTLRVFEPGVVPGLLQTADYALRIIELSDVTGRQGHENAVAGRLRRQEALFQPGRRFQFILTEAALRWQPASAAAQLAQLDRIGSLATLDNVSIGLVPREHPDAGLVGHGFVLYDDIADSDPFVRVEVLHAVLTVSSPEDVELYRAALRRLGEAAAYGADARALLGRVAAEVSASV